MYLYSVSLHLPDKNNNYQIETSGNDSIYFGLPSTFPLECAMKDVSNFANVQYTYLLSNPKKGDLSTKTQQQQKL